MKPELKECLTGLSLEEMQEVIFFLLPQIYALLDEEAQQKFFLKLFKGEEGRVPSMVYY
ncbi:hypothetical protein [Thermosulfurimonas sp. F29]|uniref:hypothetical protein n=1 Tax=Thermosulfurimonas sp. F29 TaxID=2867247 RepID=UPI001C828237|nr:hypothetical protein [Thermosulfurimonas sp. F29]MBX6424077.1 hypothetical protein [Thermosulfurimonas sp. F29]